MSFDEEHPTSFQYLNFLKGFMPGRTRKAISLLQQIMEVEGKIARGIRIFTCPAFTVAPGDQLENFAHSQLLDRSKASVRLNSAPILRIDFRPSINCSFW